MKHLKSSNAEKPTSRYFLALFICTGFLILAVFCTSPVLAQTSNSTLPPKAQAAYERGYAAAELGEWELAIKYFSEAQKAATESPEVFFNLAFACSKTGGRNILAIAWYRAYLTFAPDAPNAQQVRKEIIKLEVKAEANVIELLRLAKDTAGEMPVISSKSTSYKDIALTQTHLGDIAGARKNLALAKKLAESIEDDYYRNVNYQTIAAVQAFSGDISGAIATVKSIEDDYKMLCSAYFPIADLQAKAGNIAGASKTLALAKKAAESIEGSTYKSKAFSLIAINQAETGDISGARESLALAKKAAEGIKDTRSGLYLYNKKEANQALANARAKVDKAAADSKSAVQAKETTPAKTKYKYKAEDERRSWTYLARTYQHELSLADLQGFLTSLKEGDRDIHYVFRDINDAYESMARALKNLQNNEVKWSELRAQ